MDLHVLAQPYRDSATGQTFVTHALADEGVSEFLVPSAWARASGINLLAPGLDALRARGGKARLLFGVDLKGTSQQGVDLARKHFNDQFVIHDPSRTFHPKIYLALGDRVGYALIGSNNLTAGGLWHNYESAVIATFDPRVDSEISAGIQAYAKRLRGDKAICKRLTSQVAGRLKAEGWLANEASDNRHRAEDRAKASTKKPAGSPLFTTSDVEKRGRPAPTRSGSRSSAVSTRSRRKLAAAVDSWWKPLRDGDAQRPPSGNPTGNVTLTNVPKEHDRPTFFRKVLFGAEDWRRSYTDGKRTEMATIEAAVEIDGADLGDHGMTVVYRPYRAERSRATTVLRWGDELLDELRKQDVRGRYLLIERAVGGTYRVRVTKQQPA